MINNEMVTSQVSVCRFKSPVYLLVELSKTVNEQGLIEKPILILFWMSMNDPPHDKGKFSHTDKTNFPMTNDPEGKILFIYRIIKTIVFLNDLFGASCQAVMQQIIKTALRHTHIP